MHNRGRFAAPAGSSAKATFPHPVFFHSIAPASQAGFHLPMQACVLPFSSTVIR
jgi:hypothetical protein